MKKKYNIKRHVMGLIGGLSLQYLLGMITTFFVPFPEGMNEHAVWQFAWKQPVLAAHMIVGTLLVLGSMVLLVQAIRLKDKTWIKPAVGGFLGVLTAAIAGEKFMPMQMDSYSFVMSIGFLIAFISYGWGLVKHK